MSRLIDLPLRHCRADILRYLGYHAGKTEIDEQVEDLLKQTQLSFQTIAQPHAIYCSGNLQDFALESYWDSCDLGRVLGVADRVTLMAVTLGAELDAQIDSCFASGDYAQAAIYDALGSDAAEQAMQSLYELVSQEAREQGFVLTPRFSPGYGDLALQEQGRLHQLVGGTAIGLTVTAKHLLSPIKSVTALAGWLPVDQVAVTSKATLGCESCRLPNCQYRRHGENKEVGDEA